MKEKNLETLSETISTWEYPNTLPKEWYGYSLIIENKEHGDMYDLFTYSNEADKRSITAYFHEETMEYKLRVSVGLTEFCQMQFITAKLEYFEGYLNRYLENTIHDLAEYNPNSLSYIMREKKITEWDYKALLPNTLEGFNLYITPKNPVRVLNGSYIIFDYSDFALESNFVIYYNEFRDEFYGEARIKNIPEMNYVFDSKNIPELEEKLKINLSRRLREIRDRATKV